MTNTYPKTSTIIPGVLLSLTEKIESEILLAQLLQL